MLMLWFLYTDPVTMVNENGARKNSRRDSSCSRPVSNLVTDVFPRYVADRAIDVEVRLRDGLRRQWSGQPGASNTVGSLRRPSRKRPDRRPGRTEDCRFLKELSCAGSCLTSVFERASFRCPRIFDRLRIDRWCCRRARRAIGGGGHHQKTLSSCFGYAA